MKETLDYSEVLIGKVPVTVRRRVRWGECDPAGVVYTPRFVDFAVAAADWFVRVALGFVDRPHPLHQQIVYPMRSMSFDFTSFLAADDEFEMVVLVSAISSRTYTLDVAATRLDRETLIFRAQMTSVCFDQGLGRAVELPDPVRAGLERYRVLASSA